MTRSPLVLIYNSKHTPYRPSAIKNKSVPPSTNHCYTILTQYTASSSRNARLSQIDLVFHLNHRNLECYLINDFLDLWMKKPSSPCVDIPRGSRVTDLLSAFGIWDRSLDLLILPMNFGICFKLLTDLTYEF